MKHLTWIVEATVIRKLPEMEKPYQYHRTDYEMLSDEEIGEDDEAWDTYEKALSTMPTIERADKGKWSIGDRIEEGVDFEIEKQFDYGYHAGVPDWGDVPKKLIGCAKAAIREIAVPISNQKEEVKADLDGWKDCLTEPPLKSGYYIVYDANTFGNDKRELYRYDAQTNNWFWGADCLHPQYWHLLPEVPESLINELNKES